MSAMTRVVFFGSPESAAEALRELVDQGHDVVAVFTRPDRKSGRAKEPQPTPVKAAALELGLPVFTPPNLRGEDLVRDLAEAGADVFVVVAYGRILPAEVLKVPRLGVLNVHPSLLPLYRGPSPVVSAIRDGVPETGVSVMLLDEGMDTGPVIAQSDPVPITSEDDAETLTEKLFGLGVGLMLESIPLWARGELQAMPQDDAVATVTGLIEKADGELSFDRAANEIERMVRAYRPWPGTFTRWNGKLLKILEADVATETGDAGPHGPGIVAVYGDDILIGTGDGVLGVRKLQIEGKGPVTPAEFVRGYPDINGASLPS